MHHRDASVRRDREAQPQAPLDPTSARERGVALVLPDQLADLRDVGIEFVGVDRRVGDRLLEAQVDRPRAFVGGLAAVTVVLALGRARGRSAGPLRLVLSGVGLQAICFAGTALFSFLFADRAPAFMAFLVGSLNGLGWHEAALVGVPTAIGLALAMVARRPLDVLLLDDATAGGLGVSVRRARFGTAALGAWLAAGAVSVAGLVGFVGLVVPNAVRMLVGPEHRDLLPVSALAGATLTVAADTAARTLAAPIELPVGALLAMIGGPYFLFVLWRRMP